MRTLFITTLCLFCFAACAQEADKTIIRNGVLTQDTYLAGERVIVSADVNGDLILAAGSASIDGQVSGDVMAAAGEIILTAELADDLRVAGGDISLCGAITGDAVLAGGDIDICADTIVGNNLWIAAGDATLNGTVENDLTIKGGDITLSGKILGNANISAHSIEILPGTEILGNFEYSSPEEASIHSTANISGEVTYTKSKGWWGRKNDKESGGLLMGAIGFLLIALLSISISALVVSKTLPKVFSSTPTIIRTQFLQSLGVGLIAILVTPIIMALLAITVVGIPLAVILLLLYLLMIIGGLFAGLLVVADMILQWIKNKQQATKTKTGFWYFIAIILATLLLIILNIIPLVGGVILFLLYLTGVGAVCLYTYKTRSSTTSQA